MSLKVALTIPTMDQGGAEKQLSLLAKNLPRDSFEVRVFLLTREGPLSDSLRREGIPVEVIGKRFKADPSALFRLKRAFESFSPDIVHTWLFAANSFGRVAAKLAGVPTIIASERCVDPWKTMGHFFIDRQLARFTKAITTNSHGVVDFYVRHGIDRNLFHVIPNGVFERAPTSCTREDAFSRLKVDPSRRLILAVGRLWPQKRYRDLIWAGELLATTREETTLVIIGDGPQSAELLRYRDATSKPEHVRFAGHRDDVAELLPHADVFWIGSEYEGQSNAVIEAMQAGVPVVASRIPGNIDLVESGSTGILVDLGDTADFARQTNVLLEDNDQRKRFGQAGQAKIARDFSVEEMINMHEDLYEKLASV